MKKISQSSDDAVFITIDAACRLTNLGKNTVRKLSQEANAARKIGKSLRINRERLLDYIDALEA